ncbi:MAG: GDP-mannose 4,6-dehydratase [Desulfuromonadales bacterium C00003093]|nr:MAG: GDP-mannose 4,6-dehydratase [Desulfuromonadales bacterium C00003093]
MQKKRALITGITGQDGSYLAEILLDKGYEVFGLVRRVAFEDESHRMHRIAHIMDRVNLLAGSMESFPTIYRAIREINPDEVYHLAAQSYVSNSFEDEFSTINTNINGTHNMLAACRDMAPDCRFYFAGTSEMFGRVGNAPQNEETCFRPRSAYGISKVAGFELTRNYRENYKMFACSGILYNHESPRRGFEFVTRKITSHAAMIKLGLKDHLELGNLDAGRDWGHAGEYMEAVRLMLQQNEPKDYVICTGRLHSVRDFCGEAFKYVGLNYTNFVRTNPKFFREDTEQLVGDPSLARKELNWTSTVSFQELVHEMVEHDIQRFAKGEK